MAGAVLAVHAQYVVAGPPASELRPQLAEAGGIRFVRRPTHAVLRRTPQRRSERGQRQVSAPEAVPHQIGPAVEELIDPRENGFHPLAILLGGVRVDLV